MIPIWGVIKTKVGRFGETTSEWCAKPTQAPMGMDMLRVEVTTQEAAEALAAHYTKCQQDAGCTASIHYAAKQI